MDWLHRVDARLEYDYNNATIERILPLIEQSFIDKIFPDYPCLYLYVSNISGIII